MGPAAATDAVLVGGDRQVGLPAAVGSARAVMHVDAGGQPPPVARLHDGDGHGRVDDARGLRGGVLAALPDDGVLVVELEPAVHRGRPHRA